MDMFICMYRHICMYVCMRGVSGAVQASSSTEKHLALVNDRAIPSTFLSGPS